MSDSAPTQFRIRKPIQIISAQSSVRDDKSKEKPKSIIPADVTYSTFSWPTIPHGDCHMNGAILFLFSNGTAEFQGSPQTTDGGDVWLVKSLALNDSNGLDLFNVPQFDGPTMTIPNQPYWFYKDFFYPAYLFTYISTVTMYHHC